MFVLLYKEMSHVGMDNNSAAAKDALTAEHPNIHVMRHPNQIIGAIGGTGHAVAQSHHEKLLIVDSAVGFVGGIDFAPGRYCDPRRIMGDPHGRTWRGHDYHSPQGIPGLERWKQLRASSVTRIRQNEARLRAQAAASASPGAASPGEAFQAFFQQLPSFFQVPAAQESASTGDGRSPAVDDVQAAGTPSEITSDL